MIQNKKIIIGLVGESGSGKDTVADYLSEKYGAILMRFADPLRETLSLYVQTISREDLQWFSFALRNRFGNKVLSGALRKKIEPIKKRVTEDFEPDIKKISPDVLIDGVDNLPTRAILNHFALEYRIPLISGGTDHEKGQVVVYVPEKSSCLNCKMGVDKALVEARQSRSCINAPTSSVVVVNHTIGGHMAAEARCTLDSENYGEPVRKTIKYDMTKPVRAGLISTDKPCTCRRGVSAKTWIGKIMKKAASPNQNQKLNEEGKNK